MCKVFCYLIMFTLVNLSFVNLSLGQNVIYSQDFEDPAQMDWILNSPIDYLGTVESTVNFFQVNDIYAGGNVNGNIVPNTDPQVIICMLHPFKLKQIIYKTQITWMFFIRFLHLSL